MRNLDVTGNSGGETTFLDGCAHCGSRFSRGEWHPVVTEPSPDDGKPIIYSFCDEECKAAWSGD